MLSRNSCSGANPTAHTGCGITKTGIKIIMQKNILYSSYFKIHGAGHASVASRSGCSRAKPITHTGLGIVFIVLLFLAGCSNGKVQLGGTVTFDDGTPLTSGAVIFSTDTFSAKGNIDSSGKYIVGSIGTNDGIPAGKYKVHIEGATEDVSSYKGETSHSLIGIEYTTYDSTPLSCEVPVAGNNFDIKVPKFK
ncbi:MAG: DUF2271 domain-containing protein [Planctomycetaceae bacterium]|jgi:hypothetical protein|nr:DUF2271 domain-containing protein [Planctomycetaceae bacterium]